MGLRRDTRRNERRSRNDAGETDVTHRSPETLGGWLRAEELSRVCRRLSRMRHDRAVTPHAPTLHRRTGWRDLPTPSSIPASALRQFLPRATPQLGSIST